jgi:hypothetical protein
MSKKSTTTQQDKDDAQYNRLYQVRTLALEILRNGSSLMTMAEAMAEASKSLS